MKIQKGSEPGVGRLGTDSSLPAYMRARRRISRELDRHVEGTVEFVWLDVTGDPYADLGLNLGVVEREFVGRNLTAAGWAP